MPLRAQEAKDATRWIASHLEPLSGGVSGPMPAGLAEIVAGARVVGLGESAHHTRELLQLRSRLTRELVERHGFRAVAMETGYADALLLDAWLRDPSVAEPDLAKALPYAGDGELEELREPLRWLRAYNATQPANRRVRFIGIDLSNGGGALRPPFDRVWEYLDRVDPAIARASRERLGPVLDRIGSGYSRTAKQRFDSLSAGEKSLLDSELASLRDRIGRRRSAHVRSSTTADHEGARHALDVAAQTLEFMRSDARDPANPRDHALASNVEWTLASLPARSKLIVWAHNAHVQKQPIDVPQMQMPSPPTSMGELLSRRFGDRYRAIGTVVDRIAPDSARAEQTSIDGLFAAVGAPAFLLNLRGVAPASSVPLWFRRTHPMRFESLYLRTAPALAFDALVYLDHATPATRITR